VRNVVVSLLERRVASAHLNPMTMDFFVFDESALTLERAALLRRAKTDEAPNLQINVIGGRPDILQVWSANGCSRGLGLSICKAALRAGHHVVVTARNNATLTPLNRLRRCACLSRRSRDFEIRPATRQRRVRVCG
jgi:hypothetical protein